MQTSKQHEPSEFNLLQLLHSRIKWEYIIIAELKQLTSRIRLPLTHTLHLTHIHPHPQPLELVDNISCSFFCFISLMPRIILKCIKPFLTSAFLALQQIKCEPFSGIRRSMGPPSASVPQSVCAYLSFRQ